MEARIQIILAIELSEAMLNGELKYLMMQLKLPNLIIILHNIFFFVFNSKIEINKFNILSSLYADR